MGGLSQASGIETDGAEPSEIPSHGHDARDVFAVTVHGLRVEAVTIRPAAAEYKVFEPRDAQRVRRLALCLFPRVANELGDIIRHRAA